MVVVLVCDTSARLQAKAPQHPDTYVRSTAPPQGLSLPAKVIRNHDGDTLTVEIRLVVNVRLCGDGGQKQCWAPELIEPMGKESQKSLQSYVVGKHGTLFVPIGNASNLSNLLTLGRVLGDFWVDGEDESVSERQVRTGMASSTKGGKLGE